MSQQTQGVAGLKKHDIKVSGIVFMLYCLVGAGAFGIEEIIPASGPGMTLILLMVFPIIWAYPISNLVAECGAVLPSEGGVYVWAKEAFGEFWGFQIGWLKNIGIYINVAVFVVLSTDYLASYLGLNNLQSYICKIIIIGVFTWINLRGVKDVAIVSSIISGAILVAFAGIAIIGFIHFSHNPFEPVVATGQTVVGSIGSSIAIGMWMYAGYESMSSLAGEVKDPQMIPKAIIIALPLIIGTYVLPTVASLGAIGQWDKWGSEGVSYVNVAMQFAPAFGVAFVMVAFISNISMFNVYLASGARGFFVMAEDNLAPKALVKCDKKRGVPYVAIISLSVVSLILCAFKFDILVTIVSLFNLGLYSLIMISQIVLRRKEPDLPRPYRIKMGKVGTDIFCAVPVVVAFIALYINGADYFVMGLLGMISGPIAYIIFKKIYGGLYKNDPEKYPINEKTKLAVGDTKRISFSFGLLAVLMIIGRLFLPGYEDHAYYAEAYGVDNMFDILMMLVTVGAAVCAVLAVIFGVLYNKTESKEAING